MPTLPLFSEPTDADASHQIASPGGYERWHFHIEGDSDTRVVQILADFSIGPMFDPQYLRRYAAYRRRPTHRAPPVPRDYPCVEFGVYRAGVPLARFANRYPADTLSASSDSLQLTIGPNQVTPTENQSYRLNIESGDVIADLTFDAMATSWREDRPGWTIPIGLGTASGTVRTGSETITFRHFEVYHDHFHGTCPVPPNPHPWFRGSILMGHQAFAFHSIDNPRQAVLHEFDRCDERIDPVDVVLSGRGFVYPKEIVLDDRIRLFRPRPLRASWCHAIVAYDATACGTIADAICEFAYPTRLRSPLLGRLSAPSFTFVEPRD